MTTPATPTPASRRTRLVWWCAVLLITGVVAWFCLSPSGSPAPHTTPKDAVPVAAPSAAEAPRTAEPPPSVAVGAVDENAAMRAALAAALALPTPGQRVPEFGRLLRAWLARDPEAALAYVRQMPRGAEFSVGLSLVLETFSRANVDRALQLAAELAATNEERSFYGVLFARLAREDMTGAVGKLAAVPAGEGRLNALRALADVWASRDTEAALAWARQLSDRDERSAALEATLFTLTTTDPLRAVELALAQLDGPARARAVTRGLKAINDADPAGAASLVAMLPAGELQTHTAIDVARALTARDPQAALRWLDTLPAGNTRRIALNNVLSVWTNADAPAVGNYVARLDPGAAQEAAAGHYATLLATANPAAAVSWAQTLPAGAARDAALVSVASAWAAREPAAASRWASSLPPGDAQRTALAGALSYWMLESSAAASDFVGSLAPPLQPAAAASIAPQLAQADPHSAVAWAQSLPAPAAREAALTAAYTRWLDNAPAAARDWLATANLPGELKTRLQGMRAP